MGRKIVRKSLRQTVSENQAALDFMSKLAGGTGHVNKVVFEPVKARAPRGPTMLTEAQIQKTILQYLKAHPKVAFAIRVNSGAHYEEDRLIYSNSQRGMSDIMGVMKGGKAYFLEVKSQKGKLTQDQDNFLAMALESGALAGCVRSLEDVDKVLQLK